MPVFGDPFRHRYGNSRVFGRFPAFAQAATPLGRVNLFLSGVEMRELTNCVS